MDRRERADSPIDSMLAAFAGFQSKLWTALPGIVQSFDPSNMTCEVQPSIQAQVQAPDGNFTWVNLPLLQLVPVVFPSGGGCSITYPIQAGDECLVIFSSRCIDAWWQSGGIGNQVELRMHDLSDGFAIVGPRSVPKVPGGISTSALEIRSDDGTTKISLNPTTSAIEVDALTLTLNCNVILNGSLTQGAPAHGTSSTATMVGPINVTHEVTANGIPVSTHHHQEHDGPNTSGPIA